MTEVELSDQDYVSLKDKLTGPDRMIRPCVNLLQFCSCFFFFFHVFNQAIRAQQSNMVL